MHIFLDKDVLPVIRAPFRLRLPLGHFRFTNRLFATSLLRELVQFSRIDSNSAAPGRGLRARARRHSGSLLRIERISYESRFSRMYYMSHDNGGASLLYVLHTNRF